MSNQGMMTNVWGPPGWVFLHSITMGYPNKINLKNPEHLQRMKSMKLFFNHLQHVLPCRYCRESYGDFIKHRPIDTSLLSRKQLAKWFYDIHNMVNNKLGINECEIPTFKEFYDKYETYRAKCKKTTEKERQKSLEKGCTNPLDGLPKKTTIRIYDVNGTDCSLLPNFRKVSTHDLKIIKKFQENYDPEFLQQLSSKTKEYMKSSARDCLQQNTGKQKVAKLIIKTLQ